MGVDFNNGGMSYERYDLLIVSIAQSFNAIVNIKVPQDCNKVFHCFGFINRGINEDVQEKFSFNETVPNSIKKLCNYPYGQLTKKEVKELYKILKTTKNDNDYIDQFIYELKYTIDHNMKWCAW